MLERIARSKLVLPTLLTLVGLSVLIGLGTWQLQRRVWKDTIIAALKTRSAAPAITASATWPGLPCHDLKDTGLINPCEYQPVIVRGTFDHARERHIFTAAPFAPGVGQGRGYWVFTPMKLEGTGRTVFVNRGFVPEALKDASKRVVGQTTQMVEITGLYRSAQTRGWFDGENDAARNIWYVRAPSELWPVDPAGAGGLEEMWAYVDMSGPVPAGGWPLSLGGRVEMANRHLEYAITWYALAATLAAVFGVFAWGRIKAA